MNRVYLQAQEVVVDLGGASRAFEALLLKFCKLNAEPLNSFETAVREKRVLEAFKELHCQNSFWSAYEDFMKRPWFTRVWVVQEFVLAKHVTMMVGRAKFPSDFLIRVLERVMWHLNTLTAAVQWDPMYAVNFHQITKSFHAFEYMCEMRFKRQQYGCAQKFTTLFNFSIQLNATDKRDYVYAMLGLAEQLDLVKLPVNYSESEATLSLRVARFLIGQGLGVYALSRAGGLDPVRASWVPSLDLTSTAYGLSSSVDSEGSCHLYQACGPTTPYLVPSDQFLVIRGGVIGRISLTFEFVLPLG